MKIKLLTFLLVLSSHLVVFGQRADYGSSTNYYEVSSNEAKDYQLKVTLPDRYDENQAYKVLYYLDAWWLSESVLGSHALLSISENIDEVVLVGITIDGDLLDWNIQRTLDFTPSIYNLPIDQKAGLGDNAIELDSSSTGGADVFIDFLETKVLKFIDGKFPNLEKGRGFIGHSFGGLLGFYIMQEKPDMFTDFIIISPALWWNKTEVVVPELFNDFMAQKHSRKLYLSYGEDESNWIVKSNIKMNGIINNLEQDGLDYKFVAYEGVNHNSILTRAIYDGLLFLYKK